VIKELKQNGVKLGSIGACWGYKVIVTNEAASEFSAAAGIHPSCVLSMTSAWSQS
jgi:dienelactone hydrolase